MDRIGIGTIGLAALIGAGVSWGALHLPVEARLERAAEMVFERRPHEAAAEYRAMLARLDPDTDRDAWVEALARLGEITYLELSDPKSAAHIYRRLVAGAPHAEESWIARERLADLARNSLGDPHEAIAQWEALAHSGRPGADRFAYQIARTYLALGDYEQCRHECRALADRSPDGKWTADALFLAATSFQAEGKHAEAIEAFEKVEARFGDSPLAARARYQVGQSKASQRDWEGAQAAMLSALETHPDPWRVQAELARVRKHLAQERRIQPLSAEEALAR